MGYSPGMDEPHTMPKRGRPRNDDPPPPKRRPIQFQPTLAEHAEITEVSELLSEVEGRTVYRTEVLMRCVAESLGRIRARAEKTLDA